MADAAAMSYDLTSYSLDVVKPKAASRSAPTSPRKAALDSDSDSDSSSSSPDSGSSSGSSDSDSSSDSSDLSS